MHMEVLRVIYRRAKLDPYIKNNKLFEKYGILDSHCPALLLVSTTRYQNLSVTSKARSSMTNIASKINV
jgi:hypothetical protein